MGKILDQWIIDYLKSSKTKETSTQINKHLENIMKDENQYLV